MSETTRQVAGVLRRGASVHLIEGYELSARTYPPYEGLDPTTGATVPVPARRHPLFRRTSGVAPALTLTPEPELVTGARVWPVRGVGLVYGFDKGASRELRGFRPFAALRAALNAEPEPAMVPDDDLRAALAGAPSPGDVATAVRRLEVHRTTRPALIDVNAIERKLAGPLPGAALEAMRSLAGCDLGALAFADPAWSMLEPSEPGVTPGVSFAYQPDEGAWSLQLHEAGPRLVETNARPNDVLTVDAFLVQAAIAVDVAACAGARVLTEVTAYETVRLLLAVHPGFTRLVKTLPF